MRSSSVEEVGGHGPGDPWEVFSALAILVVEGRTPGGERGYHAGPHCPLPHQLQHKHSCDQNDHVCAQAGALVRQLRVMWGVGVGVSLEVLVAPECQHGAALATTLDTPIAPSQNLRLIEQWNFTIFDRRHPEATATGWSLVAAVRSFLHFSQLSAWLSVSRGRRPPNVLYRLTVTSPVFCSKFTEEAEEHVFPLAYMGQETSIKVAVRSLPRSEKVPVVVCYEPHEENCVEMPSDESLPSCSQSKTEMTRGDKDLRRSVMKARLAENSRVSRSESPDTQLGESLLDPPNSLTRFPRRYQSPSRSGSPSLETPEHLICRLRHPVPPNSRPPDFMPLGPSTARHPFSWTQARYPVPPVNLHPTSLASVCPSTSGMPHHHQHQSSHQMQQHSPYRIDYSGPSHSQHFQRPHLVYSRPQACLAAQLPSVNQLHLQKPHSSHHNLQSVNFDQFQKQPGRLSPRGGKYQNYPEYQYNDHAETSRDYVGPSKRYKSQRLLGDECSESDSSYNFPEVPHNVQGTSGSSSMQGGPVQRREDGESSSDWECMKNSHNGNGSCLPQLSAEAVASHSGAPPQKVGGKGSGRLKRGSSSSDGKRCKTEEEEEEEEVLPKVIDDQLRPCCSHTGKHLCSSMEDLSEVCDKEPESSCQLHSKDIKQEMKHRRDVSPSHLFRSKFNFDLTPKETMEILSVLRQPSNLRIESPRSHSKVSSPKVHPETKTLHLGLDPDMKSEKQLWADKELERKVLKDKGKRLEDHHFGLEFAKAARDWEIGESSSSSSHGKVVGQTGPKSSLSSLVCSEHRCQKESRVRGGDVQQRETASSPENQFLEAIALSSEKQCDILSCKTLVDSREPLWTRVCSDNNACDNGSDLKKEGIIYSLEETYRESGSQQCVEAKKMTLKTNFYTACSEPAKAIHCQPQKQVSHTLSKSPFSAILSSIQNEYNQEMLGEQLHLTGHSKATSSAKEPVKRVLNFQEDGEKYVRQEDEEEGPSKSHPDQNDWKENVARSRETREGFVKSASLLKHLMTRGHLPQPQENSQGDRAVILDGSDYVDTKQSPVQLETGQKIKHAEHDANQQLGSDSEMQVDDEVEKYCNMRGVSIPSASEKAQFRRSLDSATNMVFHSKTGLPLTSSPAPLRKGKRFDYDSSLVSVAAIKRSTSFHCSALYTCDTEEEEAYNLEMHAVCSEHKIARKSYQLSMSAPATVTCSNLLGSFEECVLNGRLEPVSTVQGFTAEIAASGTFCPKRITKPVTVFFYTLCDNDQISSPYMGHINLGKKGYHVPNKGTVQVTLFNPHCTVVKMFVVMYDLSDMPPNSRTFVRQRTLNMPVGASDADYNAHQWLRYLIHLRFVSSKSGKIYLHTDIRMLILRKSDADAATLHKTSVPYELRSFTHGPTNPKFSPRK